MSASIRTVPESSDLELRLGRLDLRVTPDLAARELTLRRIRSTSGALAGEPGVRVSAELSAYTPGSGDAEHVDRDELAGFLEALHRALSDHDAQLSRRRGQLALRKLSTIYEDQLDREERESTIDVFVIGHRRDGGASELDIVLLGEAPPEWLSDAFGTRRPRIALETSRRRYEEVESVRSLDEAASTVRVRARGLSGRDAPAIRRLSSTRSGVQQRLLIRALEDTMLGLTTHPGIRKLLLEAGGRDIAHELEGPEALREAVMASDDLFAVWGLPGAGKTRLVVELIADFLRARGDRPTNVLVVAPTHVAVDKVLEGLAAAHPELEPDMVRYASEARIEDSVVRRLWYKDAVDEYEERVGSLPEHQTTARWRDLLADADGKRAVMRWVLSSKRVHGATCVGMASGHFGLTERVYDLVVVDEVGKCFAAELLLPASRARRLVVVGDHHQLPPTVTSEVLDERIGYRLPPDEVEELLRESYFAMLFRSLPADRKGIASTRRSPRSGRKAASRRRRHR